MGSRWNDEQARRVLLIVRPESRDVLVDALRDQGFEVEVRNDPMTALSELRRGAVPPGTVILDWSLPATGSQFLRNFASNPRFTKSHIIVLSSSHKDVIPSLCVSAILPQPISPDLVLRTVEALGKR